MEPSFPNELASRTDSELLRRYLDGRDAAALTALITRHAALVRGVCQRVLGDTPDADDAFQATFLVLIRRGERILKPVSLAAWLYGVAHRIACRQRRHQRPAVPIHEGHAMAANDPLTELAARHDAALFDAALARLPEKYRAPIVLHHLEGKTHQEVAAELKLTESAVDGLLKRGRNELRVRLARQGVVLGVTLAAVEATQTSIAAASQQALIETTIQELLSYDPILHPQPTTNPVRLAHQEISTMGLLQPTKAIAWTIAATVFLGAAGIGIAVSQNHVPINAAGLITSTLLASTDDAVAQVEARMTVPNENGQPAPELRAVTGVITRVDHASQLVSLSVGSNDGVKLGARFEIAVNKGGTQEMKGLVEVIRVFDDAAEARIIMQDFPNQIAVNDAFVFAEPARSHAGEVISIIGDVDLDGDGKSDREMFHQILKDAGIEIEIEVNDAGDQSGEKVSEKTKFLVIGTIPDGRGANKLEWERVRKVRAHFRDLYKEAKSGGVRVIYFNDFLDYIGQPKANPVPDPDLRPIDFRKIGVTESRIEAALQDQTEISFTDTSLKDALDYIEDLHGIQFLIDTTSIEGDGGTADGTVTLKLRGVQLQSGLNRMLAPLDLDYVIKDEIMLITTANLAMQMKELRIYDLADFQWMLGEIDFKDETAVERHAKAIKEAVGGEWEGGYGTLLLSPGGVIVRHNQRVHREIENLVKQLRRARE